MRQGLNDRLNMPDYYQENYEAYHEGTFSIDPASFLEPFAQRLPPGSLVLDVGCGSGRDLLWFKRRGFKVIGFERSQGLARLARENAGCEVIEGDFERYDFSGLSVDAILMSGSLVHVPHAELLDVFEKITQALSSQNGLKPSADMYKLRVHVYVSLKEGDGTWSDGQGRTFYLWQDDALRGFFNKHGFRVVDFSRSESAIRAGDVWLGYVLKKTEQS